MGYEDYLKTKEKLKFYIWYIVIGTTSVITTIFLPMVGSSVNIQATFPTTKFGWFIWIVTKLVIAGINMIIFHSFIEQAKVNVRDDPNYKKANELLNKVKKDKEVKPQSPKKFFSSMYGFKGFTIMLMTMISLVAFSQVVISYNYQDLIVYGFTIVMGIMFGLMSMMKTEYYLTVEYLKYAEEKTMEEQCSNTTEKS